MASIRQLKSRIRSVSNTRQITKAMEMVAASKMRRAQDASKMTQPYSRAARELLTSLAGRGALESHPLYTEREVKKRIIILITSNKGLAGAYNANAIKKYITMLKADADAGIQTQTIAIGRKGAQLATKLKGNEVLAAYEDFSEKPTGHEVKPIIGPIIEAFTKGDVDAVDVVYTEYINSITQKVATDRLLPAGFTEVKVSESIELAKFEPSTSEVLEGATIRFIEAQLFQTLLDSVASEHSMRMVAMKNATDNASDLKDDLTLAMNKVRQGAITQELAEISSGAEAVK